MNFNRLSSAIALLIISSNTPVRAWDLSVHGDATALTNSKGSVFELGMGLSHGLKDPLHESFQGQFFLKGAINQSAEAKFALIPALAEWRLDETLQFGVLDPTRDRVEADQEFQMQIVERLHLWDVLAPIPLGDVGVRWTPFVGDRGNWFAVRFVLVPNIDPTRLLGSPFAESQKLQLDVDGGESGLQTFPIQLQPQWRSTLAGLFLTPEVLVASKLGLVDSLSAMIRIGTVMDRELRFALDPGISIREQEVQILADGYRSYYGLATLGLEFDLPKYEFHSETEIIFRGLLGEGRRLEDVEVLSRDPYSETWIWTTSVAWVSYIKLSHMISSTRGGMIRGELAPALALQLEDLLPGRLRFRHATRLSASMPLLNSAVQWSAGAFALREWQSEVNWIGFRTDLEIIRGLWTHFEVSQLVASGTDESAEIRSWVRQDRVSGGVEWTF